MDAKIAFYSSFFSLYTAGADPLNFEEAVKIEKWRDAMDAKMATIEKNSTWELIDWPKGAKVVGVKWVTRLNSMKREKLTRLKQGW